MTRQGHAELRLTPDSATPGALPGALNAGRWRLEFEVVNLDTEGEIEIDVSGQFLEDGLQGPALPNTEIGDRTEGWTEEQVISARPGWYCGELHAHSVHSSGQDSVEALVQAAAAAGLAFLALTDHNTSAGWAELARLQRERGDIVLLPGLELTTTQGHANAHGLSDWVSPFPSSNPGADQGLSHVAAAVHQQGGLFGVNHPFSNEVGWQDQATDWASVDLIEVYHHLEYAHNTLQLAFWDGLLNQGFAVVGVAATDTKNAHSGRQALGHSRTWVYADQLSRTGVLAGLKSGRVYVTLGCTLDFWASGPAGERVEMHQHLPLGEVAEFHIELQHVPVPCVLYVLKNGLFFRAVVIGEASAHLTITDQPRSPAYFRLELHTLPLSAPNGYDRRVRSWETFQAASNPIFVGGSASAGRWK